LYQEPQEQQQGPPSEHQSFNESGWDMLPWRLELSPDSDFSF
jgi:hypothetical protein